MPQLCFEGVKIVKLLATRSIKTQVLGYYEGRTVWEEPQTVDTKHSRLAMHGCAEGDAENVHVYHRTGFAGAEHLPNESLQNNHLTEFQMCREAV